MEAIGVTRKDVSQHRSSFGPGKAVLYVARQALGGLNSLKRGATTLAGCASSPKVSFSTYGPDR